MKRKFNVLHKPAHLLHKPVHILQKPVNLLHKVEGIRKCYFILLFNPNIFVFSKYLFPDECGDEKQRCFMEWSS